MKLSSRWGHHRVKIVSELIGSCENGVVLDLGCGIGTFTIKFSKESSYVVGVDQSARATKISRSLLHKEGLKANAEIVRADVQYLPFRSRTISNIICADLVEHLYPNQYHNLLSECKRVLCKGAIGIFTPNPSHIFEMLKSHNFILGRDETHVCIKNGKYLSKSLEEHGFKIIRFYYRESHLLFFNIIEKILMKTSLSLMFSRKICLLAKAD